MGKKLTVKATTPSRPQITEKFLQVLFDCRQESRFLQKAVRDHPGFWQFSTAP